jgi:hypothetical protein
VFNQVPPLYLFSPSVTRELSVQGVTTLQYFLFFIQFKPHFLTIFKISAAAGYEEVIIACQERTRAECGIDGWFYWIKVQDCDKF